MNNSEKRLIKILLSIFIISFSVLSYVSVADSDITQREEGHYSKKYNFTTDWFTSRIPVWKKVLSNFEGQPNINYLEIGVFEGRSLLWLLENILTHPTSTATGIEPFVKETLLTNLEMSGVKNRTKILKGYSQVELKNFPNNSFDIIYIDGDHHASAVLTDAVLSWPLLKIGGILIFDDYLWNIQKTPPEERPQIAIDAFLASYKRYIDVIHFKWQCIVRKKGNVEKAP